MNLRQMKFKYFIIKSHYMYLADLAVFSWGGMGPCPGSRIDLRHSQHFRLNRIQTVTCSQHSVQRSGVVFENVGVLKMCWAAAFWVSCRGWTAQADQPEGSHSSLSVG